MISTKKNKHLELDIPEFVCDSGVGDHLNDYPMLSHLNGFYFTAFIGNPAQVKHL